MSSVRNTYIDLCRLEQSLLGRTAPQTSADQGLSGAVKSKHADFCRLSYRVHIVCHASTSYDYEMQCQWYGMASYGFKVGVNTSVIR